MSTLEDLTAFAKEDNNDHLVPESFGTATWENKLANSCRGGCSLYCCDAVGETCRSAGLQFKYFWPILALTIVWFVISIIVVSSERSSHWEEFETLVKDQEIDTERNRTKTLLRSSVAIALNYTESISIFMIFFNLISSLLCGTLFAMLVYRYSELYTTKGVTFFNGDPPHSNP